MADAVDKAAGKVAHSDLNGSRLIDDGAVAYRLGRSVARMEAALSAPSVFGRVALAQTMRDISPDLMDIHGTASSLPFGTDGVADDGAAKYIYRFAPLVGIYGGTLEVFRNMIAQYVLGLGRPKNAAACDEEGFLARACVSAPRHAAPRGHFVHAREGQSYARMYSTRRLESSKLTKWNRRPAKGLPPKSPLMVQVTTTEPSGLCSTAVIS